MRSIADSPTILFSGGLGDFFRRAWLTDVMKILDEAEDMVNVLQMCNNHSANDILYWHPKRHLFRLFDGMTLRMHWVRRGADAESADRICFEHFGIPFRTKAGNWYANPKPLDERGPVRFYRPQWYPNRRVEVVPGAIVFAPGASNHQRTLPSSLQGAIVKALLASGREIHALYRNESVPASVAAVAGHPLLRLHTCLTVPATAQLVRDCDGCVCAHSAILQLAWFEGKRTVVLYPAGHPEWEAETNPYTWGRHRRSSFNMAFDFETLSEAGIVAQALKHLECNETNQPTMTHDCVTQ